MTLFSARSRDDPTPSRHTESLFQFLDRVDAPYWALVRSLLEEWFSRLPDTKQGDIRARFRDKNLTQSLSAFWELYVHELFLRLGFEIETHPDIPGIDTQPDYLLRSSDQTMYIEAAVLGDPESYNRGSRLRRAIYDEINKIPSTDFYLWVDVEHEGTVTPPLARLRDELAEWLDSLDPAMTLYLPRPLGMKLLPSRCWKVGDWDLVFRAIPKKPEVRGRVTGRIVGVTGPPSVRWVDDDRAIFEVLCNKAKKYGSLSKPYIIALMSARTTTTNDQILRGLFGPAWEHPKMMTMSKIPIGWTGNGHWLSHNGPEHCGVSAVMTTTLLRPWTVARAEPAIWMNPWADFPLIFHLPFTTVDVDLATGELVTSPAKFGISEIFDVSNDWPGLEPFPRS